MIIMPPAASCSYFYEAFIMQRYEDNIVAFLNALLIGVSS